MPFFFGGKAKGEYKMMIEKDIHKKILRKTHVKRRLLFFTADIFLISMAMYSSFWLRFNGEIPSQYIDSLPFYVFLALLFKMSFLILYNLYDISWRFVSLDILVKTFKSVSVGCLTMGVFYYLIRLTPFFEYAPLPRSVLLIDFILSLLFIGTLRASKRILEEGLQNTLKKGKDKTKILVIGAGSAGEQIVRDIIRKPKSDYVPVGFIDDDPSKLNITIHGVKVLGGREDLPNILKNNAIDEVLIAMPSAESREIREIVDVIRASKPLEKIKILPGVMDLINGKVTLTDIQMVKLEDLLGRSPVSIDFKAIQHFLQNKIVLVTGAGGSIGSELVRTIIQFEPQKLIALDIDETELFYLKHRLTDPFNRIIPVIGDIKDAFRMEEIFEKYKPVIIAHSAAYKHVPILEFHPEEAIKTNIFGTKVMAELSIKYEVEKFVFISTDKAINPTSIMGATKRSSEEMLKIFSEKNVTKFISVRFGNVLGSRGSVVPLFEEQIKKGGPVTVTHPDMKRYFMVTSEAVLLVLEAASFGKGGEVFVLDMGKPIKIIELAREMIRLSGHEPDVDIPIIFTNTRAGEKLYEEILGAEEGTIPTEYEKIFIAQNTKKKNPEQILDLIDHIIKISGQKRKEDEVRAILKKIVPTFKQLDSNQI